MKTVKQILEHINYTNDENHIVSGLSQLAESGLLDESKLPLIKRALTKKNINEMTEAEKKTLNYFVESMMTHLLSEKQDHLSKFDPKFKSGYPSEKDMPVVLVLKRKAIRVFPDHQKVGLYYSQALDKYISIPFGPNSKNLGIDLNEATKAEKESVESYKSQIEKLNAIKDDDTLTSDQKKEAIKKEQEKLRSIAMTMHPKLRDVAKFQSKSPEDQKKLAFRMSPEMRARIPGATRSAIKAGFESNAPVSVKLGAAAGALTGDAARKLINAFRKKKSTSTSTTEMPPDKKDTKSSSKGPIRGPEASYGMFGENTKTNFKNRLSQKRQEKLDEGISDYIPSWEKTKEVAKSMVPGVDAYNAYKEGRYLDAAGNLALDTVTIGAGLATGGLGAAAIRGAAGAAKAAKFAKAGTKLNAAKEAAKTGFKRSKGWKVAKGIGRVARGAANLVGGAANLAGAVLGGRDDQGGDQGTRASPGDTPRSTGGEYQFKNPDLTKVSKPGESQQTLIARSQRYWGNNPTPMPMYEQSNFNKIRILSENKDTEDNLLFEDTSIYVNNRIAKKIMNLHESLNKKNKRKIEAMINEDVTSLKKIINFAVRQQ